MLNASTRRIIAAAIDVHRAIGPGLLESAYAACLCYELHQQGLDFKRQVPIRLKYKNVTIDCAYRADLIVDRVIIVEVKALDLLAPIHARQLLTYLKVLESPVGLILNFGARTMREGIKRVVNRFPDGEIAERAEDAEKSHTQRTRGSRDDGDG
jgi:GxxExxY protein